MDHCAAVVAQVLWMRKKFGCRRVNKRWFRWRKFRHGIQFIACNGAISAWVWVEHSVGVAEVIIVRCCQKKWVVVASFFVINIRIKNAFRYKSSIVSVGSTNRKMSIVTPLLWDAGQLSRSLDDGTMWVSSMSCTTLRKMSGSTFSCGVKFILWGADYIRATCVVVLWFVVFS